MALAAVALAAVADAQARAEAAPPVAFDTVALSSWPAPGASGALFGGFPDAILNQAGDVAFLAGGGAFWGSDGWAVFVRKASGVTVPAAVLGLRIGPPALGRDGVVAFVADRGRVLWRWSEGQPLAELARAGTPPPGIPSGATFETIVAPPLVNARGEVAFAASMRVSAPNTQKNRGIWAPDGSGGLRLIARRGDPAPGTLFTSMLEFGVPVLDDAGGIAFRCTWWNLGLPDRVGICGAEPGGTLARFVTTGDRVPGEPAGVTFNSVGEVGGASERGEIAFLAGGGTGVDPIGGPWQRERSGTMVRAGGATGERAPGLPDGWYLVNVTPTPVVGPAGHVAWAGYAISTWEDDVAAWRWDAASGATLIARAGDPLFDSPAYLRVYAIDVRAINRTGDALLVPVGVGPEGEAGIRDALFYAPSGGSPFPIVRPGQSIEVAPGDRRVVAGWTLSTPGSGRQVLNDAGDVALRIQFADGSSGVLRARVFATADADGDGVRDLLDLCGDAPDPDQRDADGDAVGDACNDADDADGDEFADRLDRCPDAADDQRDADGDAIGDACDRFPDEADHEKGQLRVDLASARDARDVVLARTDAARVEIQRTRSETGRCLERRFFLDRDADGEEDSTDACDTTPSGAPIDEAGCALEQFCDALPAQPALCAASDWRNDEPLGAPLDCRARRNGCGPR